MTQKKKAETKAAPKQMALWNQPIRDRKGVEFIANARGSTGLGRNWHQVDDEWHPHLRGTRGLRTFREMRDNDAICGVIYYAMDTAIRNSVRGKSISPAEDTQQGNMVADHVDSCFDDMDSTLDEYVSDVMSMIWAGWSLFGSSYKVRRGPDAPHEMLQSKHDDGLVGWRDLPIRNQMTIKRWKWRDDGKLLGCEQSAPPDHKYVHLDFEDDHLTLFRTISNKQSPEGRSLYRNCYRSWYYLKRIQELEAIGVEKDMAGVLAMRLPVSFFLQSATADEKQTVENFRQIAERIRRGEHESIMYPASEDAEGKTGFDAHLLQSGGRRPIDTNEIIKRLESRIALSVLAEGPLLGTQGDTGSWALSSSKTHMLAIATSAMRNTASDKINRVVIPRLVHANGWPQELSPRWEWPDLETEESPEFATAIATLTNAGLLVADADVEKYVRVRYGLPVAGDISDGQMQDAIGVDAELDNRDLAAQAAAQAAVPIEAEKESPGEMMDDDQAAEFLRVSRNRIRNAIRSGKLPGAKVGNGYRIVRSDLMEYMRGMNPAP